MSHLLENLNTHNLFTYFSYLLYVNEGDTFATPVLAMLPSNNTTSGNTGFWFYETL